MKTSRGVVWVGIILLGCVALPIAAYVIGGRLAGPYAGPRGLASYLGAVYQDAARGRPLAIALLFGPLLCVAVWPLRSLLLKLAPKRAEAR